MAQGTVVSARPCRCAPAETARRPSRLIPNQEVQHIPAVGALGLIQLGIAAVGTADGDELLVLHVEELGEVAAGGLKLVALILGAAALGADVL